jgi:hypothetical protein
MFIKTFKWLTNYFRGYKENEKVEEKVQDEGFVHWANIVTWAEFCKVETVMCKVRREITDTYTHFIQRCIDDGCQHRWAHHSEMHRIFNKNTGNYWTYLSEPGGHTLCCVEIYGLRRLQRLD